MFKLFNLKHETREFGYKPLIYDEEQEEFEARVRARQNRDVTSTEAMKFRMRQEFGRNRRVQTTKQRQASRRSSFRLLLLIIALSAMSYLVIDQLLPDLLEFWFPMEYQEYEVLDPFE
jgi:hypothetical protein